MPALCRDCFSAVAPEAPRCAACGSPRLRRHDELLDLSIAHLDCDAFYAAVEKRDDPSLADKPVIVGGGRRGVVSTACYVARLYGVRSAMPMFKALKACPNAVVIRPNMKKYAAVGAEVRRLMEEATPLVEPLSLDEAFLDLSGTERLHRHAPAETLMRLARRIEQEIGITVSIGLSYNKFLAKLGSDLDKPRGFAVIGRAEARAFLAARPVSAIWGVGRAMQERLARDGLTTIAQLQDMDERTLVGRYGGIGLRLYRFARGEDARRVDPDGEVKSISAETTFDTDVSDARELEAILWPLCEKVSRRLKRAGLAGRTLTLKLKTAKFRLVTRQASLGTPTQLAEVIFREALALLRREADGTPWRLIGIGASVFAQPSEADRPTLLEPDRARKAKLEQAMDRLRERFGEETIGKGRGLRR
ncbi:MAG: DNA polymerase IV [Alphaproteobacteria bacterium]|nr:DNA polymerase IV [Alphaproteobacteria bacterium]